MDLNVTATAVGSMPWWWPSDIQTGFFLFMLGIAGAMIMVFIGGWDKLMARNARIIEIEEEIREKREIASTFKDNKTADRKMWEEMINGDEDRLDKERSFNRTTGIVLYLIIGGVVATIMATNMVEAVAFGAGWTAIIGVFGIKKDDENRKDVREKVIDSVVKDYETKINAMKTENKDGLIEAHYDGFSGAIEQIAKAENKKYDEIIDMLAKNK
ncbi:membrane hypothetical protein [groundwater metagenome]|uniref:Uncharacterized protein n=1 Tax=groundwater metagenome TaxID=717931 RepID=A0A098EAI3_9ZZZZ